MEIKTETKRYICIPKTPNFIRCSGSDSPVPVQDFTDEDLERIGKAWTNDLIANATAKRNNSKGGAS